MNKPKRTVEYKSIKNLLAKLYDCKPSEVVEFKMGVGDNKNTREIGYEELVESIEKQGIWGFNDNGIIRFWVADDCEYYLIARFFAHEAGHMNGRQYKDVMIEELKAKEYEDVAFYALKKAAKVIAKLSAERNGL